LNSPDIHEKINAVRMYEDLKTLAAFGPRNYGAPGDKSSLDFLDEFAQKEGITKQHLPCNVFKFTPISSSLYLLAPHTRKINCLPQDRSGCTPIGGISAEIVYVGCGRDQDYNGINAHGKLLLMDIWGLHLVKKVTLAHYHGAKGCILINSHPGGLRCAWGLGERPSPLPAVSVSYEDGQWLRELIAKGYCSVSLNCNVVNEPGTSEHVLMKLPAKSGASRDTVVLIAHRDTTHISPGANDNASGMAILLELTRVFKNHPLAFDLLFLFSAAEEGGGLGVSQLVRDYFQQQPALPLAVINLDMVAVGSKLYIVGGDRERRTSPELNNLLRQAGAALNYHLDDYEMDMGLADIEAFIESGVPSAWLFKPDDPRVHTECDLPEYVNPNDLKVVADIVAAALLRLKNSDPER